MILDFDLKCKNVVIVGGGPEGHRKISSFLDSIPTLYERNKIYLRQENKGAESFICSLDSIADVLVAVTNIPELSFQLDKRAKPSRD